MPACDSIAAVRLIRHWLYASSLMRWRWALCWRSVPCSAFWSHFLSFFAGKQISALSKLLNSNCGNWNDLATDFPFRYHSIQRWTGGIYKSCRGNFFLWNCRFVWPEKCSQCGKKWVNSDENWQFNPFTRTTTHWIFFRSVRLCCRVWWPAMPHSRHRGNESDSRFLFILIEHISRAQCLKVRLSLVVN